MKLSGLGEVLVETVWGIIQNASLILAGECVVWFLAYSVVLYLAFGVEEVGRETCGYGMVMGFG